VIVNTKKRNRVSAGPERDCRGASRAQLGLFLALAERKRRDPARRAILILIRALEGMLLPGHVLLPGQICEIRRLSSQIAALASSCELPGVADAAKDLCDAPEKAVTEQVHLLCALSCKV
jgi:hypothetical protein